METSPVWFAAAMSLLPGWAVVTRRHTPAFHGWAGVFCTPPSHALIVSHGIVTPMYANYREVSAPDEREPEDYTTAERRAAIFDRIEQAGHYRALQRSYRELGDHYGVSHTTIRNDITAVLEWQKDNLSPHAEAELESLKTRAVEQLLEQGEPAEAYELMRKHYEALQDMGERERPPDKHEVSGPDGGPLQREIRIGGSAGGDTTSSESPDEG